MNKRNKKLIESLIRYIYRDNIYLINPHISWYEISVFNNSIVENYNLIRPILLKWQSKGYIQLIEDNILMLKFDPDKLPIKEVLLEFSIEGSNDTIKKF